MVSRCPSFFNSGLPLFWLSWPSFNRTTPYCSGIELGWRAIYGMLCPNAGFVEVSSGDIQHQLDMLYGVQL